MTTTPNLDAAWQVAKGRAAVAHGHADALGMVEAETAADLIDAERDLARYADRLARKLTRIAERLEAEAGDGAFLNSLGEVQGDGAEIERLCAQIATMREVLRGIVAARKAAAR